ncbi:MAG: YabP/YqfC family sporulation protein, partial [Bacillota bacterium]
MPSKRDKGSLKAIISDLFELPREVMLDLPRMTMVGNIQIYLENHRGVINYDENQVRIGVKNGEIIIRGNNLQ